MGVVVAKLGSAIVADEEGAVRRDVLACVCEQVAAQRARGRQVVIVTSGAITVYEGNDSTCKPTVYTQGMGLVDAGGDHVHIIRNEGSVPATAMAVQLLPAGAARRIDVDNPGTCPF